MTEEAMALQYQEEDRAKNNAGIPPKYQVDTKPRRKDEPVKPENEITLEKVAHFPKEVYKIRVFQDHRGEEGLSCYRGYVRESQELLIPPWSYQFYIVTGLEPSASDATRFCSELFKTLVCDLSYNETSHMRFDFVFLPAGSTNISCMKHYWAEKSSNRQKGDLAIVPTYDMVGRAKSRSAENALVVVDEEDVQSKGLVWLKFADLQSYTVEGIPERMNSRAARYSLGRLDSNWIGQTMDEIYQQSSVRGELEQEFKLAIETRDL